MPLQAAQARDPGLQAAQALPALAAALAVVLAVVLSLTLAPLAAGSRFR